MKFTRRTVIRATAATLAAPALGALGAGSLPVPAAAQARNWKHALSLFGDVKYPPGFKNFDYVNPAAPQGGTVRQVAFGTFDNFNMVAAGVKGSIAMGTELFTETLTTPSLDEISTEYGLLAEAVSHPDDFSSVTYRLRANARWHDGKPVTPEDVIFSFNAFKENSPQMGAYYRHVVKAEKIAEREVTFTFDGPGNRELPQIVGQVPVIPKHWWEGTDSSGKQARRHPDHARSAARLRAVQDQRVRGRALAGLRESRRLLGQGSQRHHRHAQLPDHPLRILPRPDGGLGRFQGRSVRFPHREQRERLGNRL